MRKQKFEHAAAPWADGPVSVHKKLAPSVGEVRKSAQLLKATSTKSCVSACMYT